MRSRWNRIRRVATQWLFKAFVARTGFAEDEQTFANSRNVQLGLEELVDAYVKSGRSSPERPASPPLIYLSHHVNEDHFRFVLIDLLSFSVEIYDSLLVNSSTLRESLQWLFAVFFKRDLRFVELKNQHQSNGCDCGVFVCIYAYLRKHGWTMSAIDSKVKKKHARAMRKRLRRVFQFE